MYGHTPERFQVHQEEFDLGMCLQGFMRLIARGLCLLKGSIHVQILHGCVYLQVALELSKQLMSFGRVRQCEPILYL